tara:strand:+ start:3933 stop:6074 length:2142 start_codon:yes stop_codon:yes gene_type:complete
MSVTNRKLFNRGARDELRRKGGIMASSEPMMQAVGYENGGGVLSNIFNYFRSPTYVDPEISGRENFEIDYREENPNPEVELQMKVLEKAKAGKQVKNVAFDLGETLLDVLNLGGGAAVLGANEVAALGLDTLGILTGGGDVSKSILRFAENVRQKGLVNRNDLFDADGNLTLNTRLVGEGPYEGQLEKAKERLQATLKRQGFLSDEEKDAIRQASLANIASADMEGADLTRGVFADIGESIPAFSTTDPRGQGFIRVDGTEIAPKADEPFPQPFVGDATFPVGAKTMPSSRLNPTREGGVLPDRLRNNLSDPTLAGRGPSLNPIEQGVVSALPGVVNEPPAEVPQTMKELISEKLIDLGAGGVENIGGLFDQGVEYLEGLISGDDTPPAPTDERYAPELTTQAGPEAELSVVEELKNTAGQLTSQLTKKAQNAIDATKKKLENPQSVEEAPTLENNESVEEAPTLENNESITEVQLDDETAKESIVTDKTANNLFDGDTNLTTTITKLTKGDVGNMKDDLSNVTDDESFESYVSKYVKQYQELFKEDEDQIRKDKGFAMAIFGSVFASTGDWGQASAAMIDMLRGDKATRQARTDKVKMLAINSAADRKAADLRYKRELDVASVRSSGSNQYTEDRERSRLREEIIKNPFGHAENIYKDGKIDPELLNKYVDDIIKGSTGTGEATKTAKKLNDEAKAAGETTFTFNGKIYPVQ